MNSKTPTIITERQLLYIWRSQSLNTIDLKTTDGRKVEVIRCGQWNFDAGPDFKSALLRIGNQLRQGDVELHLKTSEWYAHKHEKDPHYNGVILHVVLQEDLGKPVIRQDYQEVPTLVLSQLLKHALDPGEDQPASEPEFQPDSKAHCLRDMKTLPWKKLMELIQEKADTRFHQKVERFEARCTNQDWDQLIYEGLLEALGYPINKKPFLKLAQLLPLRYLQSAIPIDTPGAEDQQGKRVLWTQAILLGAAGLLPVSTPYTNYFSSRTGTSSTKGCDLETEAYLNELRSLWEMLRPCFADISIRPEEWQFFRIRPFNSPTSRLARFSFVLAMRPLAPCIRRCGWITDYVNLLMDPPERPIQDEGKEMVKKLEARLLVPIFGYWKHHTGFGAGRSGAGRSLTRPLQVAIGRETVREMTINVILPVLHLYAEKTSRVELREMVYQLYKTYPTPSYNAVTKFMANSLFEGNSLEPERSVQTIRYARTHQGLIQLHSELCQMRGCPSCPYRTLF